jgi:hypothetical protein
MTSNVSWWRCGLLGSFVLLFATGVKVLRALVGGAVPGFDWAEAAGFVALMFGLGFTCGLVGWAGLGLSRRFGLAGDAMAGVAVMVVFFLGCALAFAPEILGPRFVSGGIPMFGIAVAAGLVLGPWIGRDFRREMAASAPPRQASERGRSPEGPGFD